MASDSEKWLDEKCAWFDAGASATVKNLPPRIKSQMLRALVAPEDPEEYRQWRNRMLDMLAPYFIQGQGING